MIGALARPSLIEDQTLRPPDGTVQTAVIGERSDDGAQPAVLHLEWSTSTAVAWPTETRGVVTDVFISAGTILENGSPVVSVNGVTRLAQLSGQPMYREIGRAASGPDVDWLDALLVKLGISDSLTLDSRGRATSATILAIKELQRRLGADDNGIFQPEHTVWVGTPAAADSLTMRVGAVVATVGAEAVSGSPIFHTPSSLERATLELTAPPSRQSLVSGVGLVLKAGAQVAEVSGSPLGTASDLTKLAALFNSSVSEVDVTIARRVPFQPGAAVSTSIMLTDLGQGCVISTTGDRFGARFFEFLDVDSLEPGITYVPTDLIGLTVVTNPNRELEALCDSS